MGTLALPYLKSLNAEVTCVDHPSKLDRLKSLGADHVIDYTTTDYTQTGKQYDKIIDVIAHRSASNYQRALKPHGVFAMIGGSMGGLLFNMMVVQPVLSRFREKKVGIMGYRPNRDDLNLLSRLVEEGTMVPVIDCTFPLAQGADAFRHFISGKFVGKILLEVSQA